MGRHRDALAQAAAAVTKRVEDRRISVRRHERGPRRKLRADCRETQQREPAHVSSRVEQISAQALPCSVCWPRRGIERAEYEMKLLSACRALVSRSLDAQSATASRTGAVVGACRTLC
eukprot:1414085-Prymnesium_polylepis.2